MTELGTLAITTTGYAIFFVALVLGLLMIPIGLPGTFLIVLSYLIYLVLTGAPWFAWVVFVFIFVLAILGEVIETGAGFLGAKGAKGSMWSGFAAVAGGLLGAFAGALLGMVGMIPGALLGTFAGAYGAEYLATKGNGASGEVATAALIGRVVGMVAKIAFGVVMCCLIAIVLIVVAVRA